MKIKKFLAATLSLAMLVSVCGCSGDSDKPKDREDITSADVDAETFEGFKFEVDKDLDFGGATVLMGRDAEGNLPKRGNSAWDDRQLDIKEAIESKYNVKVEYLSRADEDDFLDKLVLNHMSGKVWADLVFSLTGSYLQALTNKGVFRPLDDYIDFSNERFALTDTATKYVDGKHYSYYPATTDAGYMLFYNTSILAENNCDDPRELYDAGKWNWDAFEKIVKASTGSKNGKTIYGLAGSNILDGLMASNGMPVISPDYENKSAKCNLFTDAGKNVLELIRTLSFTYKAVDGTYGTHNGIETFNNGFAAMLIGPQYYGSFLVQTGIPYEMVPMPLGPDTDTYTNLREYCYCYSIAKNSKYDTEDLLQLAFELERNDPAIGDTYRDPSYDGKLDLFMEQYLDGANHYYDETQAKFVYDFINDEKTVEYVDWNTTNLKEIIIKNIYSPISKGEDVRSHLTSIKSVIDAALKDQF